MPLSVALRQSSLANPGVASIAALLVTQKITRILFFAAPWDAALLRMFCIG